VGNIAAFGVLIHLSRRGHDVQTFDDLAGAASRFPWAGAVMVIAMLSLIGIPPFAGFFAKFTVFRAAVAEGFVGLTVLALITSAISVGYYLRPMIAMYMREPTGPVPASEPLRARLALAILLATLAVVALGLAPGSTLDWAAGSILVSAG
jgi:NADH-quinone oxidoreductase subunit N